MKKNNIIYLVILLLLCITSCYDDESSLATVSISEVQISMTDENQKSNIYTEYQIPVDIVPTITIGGDGLEDDSNLRYEWAITEESRITQAVFEVIGTEKEFHGIINRPISSSAYFLKLTVTDTANDNLQYIYSWNLYVQSSFLDGLLVADTPNDMTTDLTLINNSQLTNNYTKGERIFRNILETANGVVYDGLLTSLTYEIQGNGVLTSSHLNQIWAISSAGQSVRFNCNDYSINGNWGDGKIFLYFPSNFEVKSYIRSSQLFIANTNNGLYSFVNTAANKFTIPTTTLAGYEINNNVYAANSSYDVYDNHLVWLDKAKGGFYSLSGTVFSSCTSYISNVDFDPNDMGDKAAITAVSSQDGSLATFLLKDDNSGEYAVYTLSRYRAEVGHYEDPINYINWIVDSPAQPASAQKKYIVPSAGKALLDKAVSVFFGHTYNVLYVATEDGIYSFTFGMGQEVSVSAVPQFTVTAGEKITKAKLYQQGQYSNQINTMTGPTPAIAPNDLNNNALIVATQSGEFEGKVSVIPMRQASAGTLDSSKALIYDGFKKILDVTTTGY